MAKIRGLHNFDIRWDSLWFWLNSNQLRLESINCPNMEVVVDELTSPRWAKSSKSDIEIRGYYPWS